MKIDYNPPAPNEYIALRLASNMGGGGKKENNSKIALDNSLYTIAVRDRGALIGFGRVVGDGAIVYVVSDVMVDINYQGRGIGKMIMEQITKYLDDNTDEDAYITLIAVKPADKLYEKYGFVHAEPNFSGMIRRR